MRQTWRDLGIPTKEPKCTPPTKKLPYIGWVFDTEGRTLTTRTILGALRLTERRRSSYQQSVRIAISCGEQHRSVCQRTMCSVVGQVRSTALVYPYLAPWVRRIEHVTALSPNLDDHMTLTRAQTADLQYIHDIMADPTRNGVSFDWLMNRGTPGYNYDVLVLTDASTSRGVGGYVATRNGPSPYFRLMWSDTIISSSHSKPDITFYEMLGVVAAAELYGRAWYGKTVHFKCDNMASCYCIAKKCACFKRLDLNYLILRLCLLAHRYRFRFWITHIKGTENNVADALSRLFEITAQMVATEQVPYPITLATHGTDCSSVVNRFLKEGFIDNIRAMRRLGVRSRCGCAKISERYIKHCRRTTEQDDCVFAQWRVPT